MGVLERRDDRRPPRSFGDHRLRAEASVVAMEDGTHSRPAQGSGTSRPAWRVGTPLVFGLAGLLFAVSAANSDGSDLRPNRYTDLASFVEREAGEANRLTARVAELDAEIETLRTQRGDGTARRHNRRIDVLEDPVGLTPKSGPGLTVTLSDAPMTVIEGSDLDLNDHVVHQQDIQAVANALWAGGAEAITIQGQRVISTTGIKCSGSVVILQGVPYAPPYEIAAVGDPGELLYALERAQRIQRFRAKAADPAIGVGYEVGVEEFVTAPAFEGLYDLRYAVPTES